MSSVTTKEWDVIIVGARCAGATLATLLARNGMKTLLLEASPRGTNLPMSTHLIQPPGVAVLDRLGLGERARAVAPPSRRMRFALDHVELISDFGKGNEALCVRRSTIDPWLQDLAETSGATFRDRHRVVDLLREGDRVVGVVAQRASGREEFRAGLVVGADGPHSTIAQRTNAPEYLISESTRGGFYAYYPAPAEWKYPWDMTLEHRGEEVRYVFRADGDMLAIVYIAPEAQVARWGGEWRAKLHAKLLESPEIRPLVEGKEQVGKSCGLLRARYFYRQPIGPGYALVGDAGHFKDYVTGMGMTDAFLDAERLARAILDGRGVAFEHFWRERDVATLPLHFDALQQGRVGFNSEFLRFTFARVKNRPEITGRFGQVAARKMSPYDLIPARALMMWMAEAGLRGRFDVLKSFLEFGKVIAGEQKEIAARKALLADVERRLSIGGPALRREIARAA